MEDGGWRMEDGGWRMEDGGAIKKQVKYELTRTMISREVKVKKMVCFFVPIPVISLISYTLWITKGGRGKGKLMNGRKKGRKEGGKYL